jgi:CRP/FNR family transcriptional regulator, anaerobic regulatory protein
MLQTATLARTISPSMTARMKAATPAARGAVACASCCLRSVCLPRGLQATEIERFGEIATAKRKLPRGATLYLAGESLDSLYAVRSGAFKTVGISHNGDEKVTGFHLAGEMMGLDAIDSGRHGYSAVALEDSEVCAIPFAALEKMALSVPVLQHNLFRTLSGDISRDQGLMLLLGSMTAEQRVAAFLLSLSRRYQRLGYSPSRFTLRMTREDIGTYLGLTLETVSRLFSKFQKEAVIGLQQRDIEIKEPARLREMVGHW